MKPSKTIKNMLNNAELQHRVYIIVYLVSSILSLIGFVLGVLFGAPMWINAPHLFTIFMCLVVPVIGRKNMYRTFTFVVNYVSILYLPFVLFTNGGYGGSGTIYLVMIIVFYAFHFKGKKLLAAVVFLNLYYTFIIVYTFYNPSVTIPYPDEISHVIDLCVAIVSVSIVLVVIAYGSFSGYKMERNNVLELMDELSEKNQFLDNLTKTDQLTGLYARNYIMEKIQEEIDVVEEQKSDFQLVMIDIDHFKNVNDTYGHLFGDEVIRLVAKALKENVRNVDIVARYGGEEFMILLTHTGEKDGLEIAECIRQYVETLKLRKGVRVTVSAGVSSYHSGDTKDVLIKRADLALYEAKETGRNKVCRG